MARAAIASLAIDSPVGRVMQDTGPDAEPGGECIL